MQDEKRATRAILASRLFTRAGDQAWDFALPVTLALLLPERLGLVVFLFLASKGATLFLLPRLAASVDSRPRLPTARLGIALQVLGVLVASLGMAGIVTSGSAPSPGVWNMLGLALVVAGSIASSLGSGLMEIALGNDWIPDLVTADGLAVVNGRLRQIDLATEVGAPVLAGLFLAAGPANPWPLGFFAVALWNVVSFLPEMRLLRVAYDAAPALREKLILPANAKAGLLEKLGTGWREFRVQPAAGAMVAYALLWLSALSPHGILLTTHLKADWRLSETTLSVFRGAGAVFGLAATVLFPRIRARLGLVRSAGVFLAFQAAMVVLSLVFFWNRAWEGWGFLAALLLSRIGLYGFGLGEAEIRQRNIPEGVRGKVNGVATSLTSLATLILFALGTVFSRPDGFLCLVAFSALSVLAALGIYGRWARVPQSSEKTG